ncbi:MAG: hypothetical protein JXQ65_02335 [Candidatus Marinimicrobia bacterium]|nr:hypothetical protein [Candidatus Neomarinimicrobiota bacterium]
MKFKNVILIFIFIPVVAVLLIRINQSTRSRSWEHLIEKHLKKYPGLEPMDIYRLINEGTYGFNEANCNRNDIYKSIKNDFRELNPEENFELLEKISPDNQYVRVDLRKYKAKQGDLLLLSEMVYLSYQKPNKTQIEKVLNELTQKIKKGQIRYDRKKWLEFLQKIEQNNYPCPNHSDYFEKLYNPAYVVVAKNIWDEQTRGVYD